MNERTYLVALSPMLGQSKLLATLALSVRWQLEQLGAPPAVAELEAEELLRSKFVTNDNKSLLSSLNDMVFHAEAYLTELAPLRRTISFA